MLSSWTAGTKLIWVREMKVETLCFCWDTQLCRVTGHRYSPATSNKFNFGHNDPISYDLFKCHHILLTDWQSSHSAPVGLNKFCSTYHQNCWVVFLQQKIILNIFMSDLKMRVLHKISIIGMIFFVFFFFAGLYLTRHDTTSCVPSKFGV